MLGERTSRRLGRGGTRRVCSSPLDETARESLRMCRRGAAATQLQQQRDNLYLTRWNARRHSSVVFDVRRLDLRPSSSTRDILVTLWQSRRSSPEDNFLVPPRVRPIHHPWPLSLEIQQLHLWPNSFPKFERHNSSRANLNNLISLTYFARAVYCAGLSLPETGIKFSG